MPAKFEKCVREVAAKKGKNSAYRICTAADAGGIKEYRKAGMDKKPANKRNK